MKSASPADFIVSPFLPRIKTLTQWLQASRGAREQAVRQSLDLIRATDDSLQAWVQVSPQPPTGDGPLAGIPFGAKDIIDTRGLATEYGSPIYQGRVGTADADIVRTLRQRGAILLGKTQTAAFAYRTPAPTRNPRDAAHTPGGSSSGSAAAVAAGMVPIALGTQTLGSVLRPASYCGVTGFKPSYGLLSLDGVLPVAISLDTLGFFTHMPADMLALWEALGRTTGSRSITETSLPIGPTQRRESVEADLQVDLIRGDVFGVPDPMPDVEPAMASAFRNAIDRLRASGASIRSIDIAGMLATLASSATTVMFYEGARCHRARFNEHGARLGDLADLVRDGLALPVERYDEAKRHIDDGRRRIDTLFHETPIVLVPAATGPAPRGLGWTGDPRMNAPWTALGTPAISIPLPVDDGMPVGLQLAGRHGDDERVIRAAVRVAALLAKGMSASPGNSGG